MFSSTHQLLRYLQGNCVKRVLYKGYNGPQSRSGCPNNSQNLTPSRKHFIYRLLFNLHFVRRDFQRTCEIWGSKELGCSVRAKSYRYFRFVVKHFRSENKLHSQIDCQMWSGRAIAGECADKVSSEQKFAVLCYITFANVCYFQNMSPAHSFAYIYIYIYVCVCVCVCLCVCFVKPSV